MCRSVGGVGGAGGVGGVGMVSVVVVGTKRMEGTGRGEVGEGRCGMKGVGVTHEFLV